MTPLRILWRFYRVVIYPILNALSGGGGYQGCRHQPSCSEYAVSVIEQRGWIRGGWAALKRILSCHPWSAGAKDSK